MAIESSITITERAIPDIAIITLVDKRCVLSLFSLNRRAIKYVAFI